MKNFDISTPKKFDGGHIACVWWVGGRIESKTDSKYPKEFENFCTLGQCQMSFDSKLFHNFVGMVTCNQMYGKTGPKTGE